MFDVGEYASDTALFRKLNYGLRTENRDVLVHLFHADISRGFPRSRSYRLEIHAGRFVHENDLVIQDECTSLFLDRTRPDCGEIRIAWRSEKAYIAVLCQVRACFGWNPSLYPRGEGGYLLYSKFSSLWIHGSARLCVGNTGVQKY